MIDLPYSQVDYTVDTNPWDRQIGCVLVLKQPRGTDSTIGYWSRSLTNAAHAYDTTHWESSRIMWIVLLPWPGYKYC